MDTEELLKKINKDYTNYKLAVMYFGLTILISATVPPEAGAVFAFLVWLIFGIGAALVGVLTYLERK